MSKENKVLIFDTTARDGKQAPGNNFGPQDTLRLAHQLEKLGVNIMEAGFPIAGPDDFEAVKLVAENISGFTTCALTRATTGDIDTAARALDNALVTPRIHTFIASSDVHIREKLNSDPQCIIEYAVQAVRYAKKYTDDVEFSPEDASRTGFDFLKQIIEATIEAGATTINIPDTVGYALPHIFSDMIARLLQEVPNITEQNIVISTHCHNDLGLATANSLAGVYAGARQVECTINGIGERAGNTHMAEVVMALNTHHNSGFCTSVTTEEIGKTSSLVSSITNKSIADNTPIVGQNVFAHGSGIHQDGINKSRTTYEIMTPESVGWSGELFPLSAQSGRAGLTKRLNDIGYSLSDTELTLLYEQFVLLAGEKPLIHNEDLHLLVQELHSKMYTDTHGWISIVGEVEYHKIQKTRSSFVYLSCNGIEFQASGSGDGPVDSAWNAIKTALQRQGIWSSGTKLTGFTLGKSVGSTDALGIAHIEVTCGKARAYGRSSDTDIVVASVKAILNALNHLTFTPVQM